MFYPPIGSTLCSLVVASLLEQEFKTVFFSDFFFLHHRRVSCIIDFNRSFKVNLFYIVCFFSLMDLFYPLQRSQVKYRIFNVVCSSSFFFFLEYSLRYAELNRFISAFSFAVFNKFSSFR